MHSLPLWDLSQVQGYGVGVMDELDAIRQDYFDQKYVESFQVGQRIRSYDFRFNRDCYVEGVIREIGIWEGCGCNHPHLHIEVTLDTLPEVARLQDENDPSQVFQAEGEFLEGEIREGDEVEARDWVFPVIPTSQVMSFSHRDMLEVLE